jgi:carbon storage regulator
MEAQGALMLVLSRRLNQTIVIAGRVRVTVLAITPNRVELGVEAPLQIAVDREEIHLRRQYAHPALAADPDSGTKNLSPRSPGSPRSPRKNKSFTQSF